MNDAKPSVVVSESAEQKRARKQSFQELNAAEASREIGERFGVAYHEVVPEESKYRYRLTNALFKEHLIFLRSLSQGENANGARGEISFDDGHRSNYENAYPLLEESGLKATFFVLAGCVGTGGHYISWEQARKMAAAGHRIQSHGWSHRLWTQCDATQLAEELVRSKRELEDRLGTEVDSLSAPGGRWNERVLEICASAGYKRLFHSNPWTLVGASHGLLLRGRLMIARQMDAAALEKHMKISSSQKLYFRTKYGLKERTRDLLGDRLYHRIWCWLAGWSPEDGMEVQVKDDANTEQESRRE
jgi:peptidoglycan/xylan/chitin deacetylase (PgdA/CDA1 family)